MPLQMLGRHRLGNSVYDVTFQVSRDGIYKKNLNRPTIPRFPYRLYFLAILEISERNASVCFGKHVNFSVYNSLLSTNIRNRMAKTVL